MSELVRPTFVARVAGIWKERGFVGWIRHVCWWLEQKIMGLSVNVSRWTRESIEDIRWRALRRSGTARVRERIMHVNPRDRGISRELIVYGIHEPTASNLLASQIRRNDVILDLGANLGYYSLLMAERLGPEGRLICVEPEPGNFELLETNLAHGQDHLQITTRSCAIGARTGRARLHRARESNLHTLTERRDCHIDTVEVDVFRLDDLVARLGLDRLNLIRMDVEGQELSVLNGAGRTLDQFRPRLVMELHPQLVGSGPVRDLLHGLSERFGYSVVHAIDRELDYPWMRRDASIHLSLPEFLESDLSHRCFTVFAECAHGK